MTTPQLQNDPIYSLAHLYISGMNVSYASTKIIGVSPGQCRDSTDSLDMPVGYPDSAGVSLPAKLYQGYQPGLLIDIRVKGINGLDIGSPVSLNLYGVYIIADSRNILPVGGLLSLLPQNQPLLPEGYDSLRLIGVVFLDTPLAFNYSTFKPMNLNKALTYINQPPDVVLTHGAATTFTLVDLTANGAVPSTAGVVLICALVTFYPASTGDYYQIKLASGGTTTVWPLTVYGIEGGAVQTQYIQTFGDPGTGSPTFFYKVSNANSPIDISIVSWTSQTNTAYPALV
jgi:hypothetical protein